MSGDEPEIQAAINRALSDAPPVSEEQRRTLSRLLARCVVCREPAESDDRLYCGQHSWRDLEKITEETRRLENLDFREP